MTEKYPLPSKKRRKATGRRSRTGCRTCKARHVKCDESPGICKNCTSTGRKCDGYDLHLFGSPQTIMTFLRNIDVHFDWATTADERRCFSYFQYHSVPSLIGLADSQLWQRLVLQMSHAEPAVYHAVNMLAAIHQESEANGMRLSGEDLSRTRHRLALEQSSRSFAMLNKRHASRDPQLCLVLLLCCLLFVMSDVLWGRYDTAIVHLRGGMKILRELKAEGNQVVHVEPLLVAEFIRLNTVSCQMGAGRPLVHIEPQEQLDSNSPAPLYTLEEAQGRIRPLLNVGIPFLTKCWLLSAEEIAQDYESLSLTQFRLLSRYYQFQHLFERFIDQSYPFISAKQQRKADLVRIQYLSQILPLKTCLQKCPVSESFIPDYEALLSAIEDVIDKIPTRTTITLEDGIIPGLFIVASSCPDYHLRLRALIALLSWPHFEGLLNSNLAASIALEGTKVELASKGWSEKCVQSAMDGADIKDDDFLANALMSVESMADWVPIRTARIPVPKARPYKPEPPEIGTLYT
ncbi:hypothetical protein BBP40_010404 [Aspergillus hancockii]|nr:hypothetical protein BBP40_010404 [Aspergillus hancockii]